MRIGEGFDQTKFGCLQRIYITKPMACACISACGWTKRRADRRGCGYPTQRRCAPCGSPVRREFSRYGGRWRRLFAGARAVRHYRHRQNRSPTARQHAGVRLRWFGLKSATFKPHPFDMSPARRQRGQGLAATGGNQRSRDIWMAGPVGPQHLGLDPRRARSKSWGWRHLLKQQWRRHGTRGVVDRAFSNTRRRAAFHRRRAFKPYSICQNELSRAPPIFTKPELVRNIVKGGGKGRLRAQSK